MEHVKQAVKESIQTKDVVIEQYQILLARLPRPLPEATPEPWEAFTRKPCVKQVPDCDKDGLLIGTMAFRDSYGFLDDRVARLYSAPFNARFAQPAHFPIPRFGPYGECATTDGVVIYEGMRFAATRDGQYDVSFTTSVPGMPVMLRLQLVFAGTEGCAYTLTLPPIAINPPLKFNGNNPGNPFQVHHAGYSHMVAEHFGDLAYTTVARQGTARFGSWPEGINQFEAASQYPVATPSEASAPAMAPDSATPAQQ